MNKNCVILQIELDGSFVCLDGQDYDNFGGEQYTEEEAAARIDILNRENLKIRYQIVCFRDPTSRPGRAEKAALCSDNHGR